MYNYNITPLNKLVTFVWTQVLLYWYRWHCRRVTWWTELGLLFCDESNNVKWVSCCEVTEWYIKMVQYQILQSEKKAWACLLLCTEWSCLICWYIKVHSPMSLQRMASCWFPWNMTSELLSEKYVSPDWRSVSNFVNENLFQTSY